VRTPVSGDMLGTHTAVAKGLATGAAAAGPLETGTCHAVCKAGCADRTPGKGIVGTGCIAAKPRAVRPNREVACCWLLTRHTTGWRKLGCN